MAEQKPPRATENRSTTPVSDTFKDYISSGWAERVEHAPAEREVAAYAAARRARISELHPGARLIIPAGPAKQRSNDTDYAYRAHSAFAHLTGWGSDSVPGSVLVMEPTPNGHESTLYFREAAGRDSDEFYANPEIGEFWTGPRPSLGTSPRSSGSPREGSPASPTCSSRSTRRRSSCVRPTASSPTPSTGAACSRPTSRRSRTRATPTLARNLSELRLVKDECEMRELRAAVAATEARLRRRHRATAPRSPRTRAASASSRAPSTAARAPRATPSATTRSPPSGPHACILHWTRNDGPVVPGDLILIDAGVELDSYYTADITRTLPVSGTFTPVQRQVYEAVREAADAAFAIVRPGIRFREIHAEAMRVIARKTAEWGLLPVIGRGVARPGPPVPPALHGARHLAPPRPRRARLRAGAARPLPRRRSSSRAWSSRSSRACTSSPTT